MDKQLRKENLEKERLKFLHLMEQKMQLPMLICSFLWLVLLVLMLVMNKPIIQIAFFFIWAIIIVDFFLMLIITPRRSFFLKNNLLIVASLIIPPIRIYTIRDFLVRSKENFRSYSGSGFRTRNNKKL